MKIITKSIWQWDDKCKQYVRQYEESYEYTGIVALACGSTSAQNATAAAQSNFYTQMTQQAQQVFGQTSAVFNQLVQSFAPTVQAGPNQQGFSQAEDQNLNSEAITQTGQSYKNAKEAVGDAESSIGGGNQPLPSGASVGANLQLASGAANQTAGELSQIQQANYATGKQNYDTAVQGLENAPGVFNSSAGFSNAATNSGSAAANTENQIAQENNSWVNALTGALGGVAGAAVNLVPH